jgi:hypothetical protein
MKALLKFSIRKAFTKKYKTMSPLKKKQPVEKKRAFRK